MTNKSGNIGTATETAVVRALQRNGFPYAERKRLRGRVDCGDITGTPGLVWEVKGGAKARNASDAQIEDWLDETERERQNARVDVAVLVVARKGIGAANADRWWAILTLQRMLMLTGGSPTFAAQAFAPVRLHLHDACKLLVTAGYGGDA